MLYIYITGYIAYYFVSVYSLTTRWGFYFPRPCVCVCECVYARGSKFISAYFIIANSLPRPPTPPCGKVWRCIENKSLAFHTSLAFLGPRCQLFAQIIKIFSHECQHFPPPLDWSPVASHQSPIVLSVCPLGHRANCEPPARPAGLL